MAGVWISGREGNGQHGPPACQGARPGLRGVGIGNHAVSQIAFSADQCEHLLLLPPRLKLLGHGRAQPQIAEEQLQQTTADQGSEGRGEQQLHQGESRSRLLPFVPGWGVHEAGRQC